jgi:hypothetical protein
VSSRAPQPCAWCGTPTTLQIVIEPADRKGLKLIRAPKMAPACTAHEHLGGRDVGIPHEPRRSRRARPSEQLTIEQELYRDEHLIDGLPAYLEPRNG